MEKIVMITEYFLNDHTASSNRARWELEALERNGFTKISHIDGFKKSNVEKYSDYLFHAQQLSGRFLDKVPYISDIHGLEFIQSSNLSRGFSFHSWKRYSFIAKSYYYKKLEKKIFKKAKHLICAGESVYEHVKNIQNSTIVRNAVNINDFHPLFENKLKIAVVGPFLPGKINYMGLDLIKFAVKRLKKIEFVFIGDADQHFRNELKFSNTKFVGNVNNYIDILRSCSVLFAPYPEYASYLGSKTKFVEAAACSMPIVTTPSGAIDFPEVLLLIGKTNENILEKLQYLKDEDVRKDLGKKLRTEIEKNFNADIEIKKLIKIYNEFLK